MISSVEESADYWAILVRKDEETLLRLAALPLFVLICHDELLDVVGHHWTMDAAEF